MSIFEQKKTLAVALGAGLFASPALALTCTFTTECMESEACAETTFGVAIDFPNHTFTTDFGDLDVVAISKTPDELTVFARGDGANYMLTVVGSDARFATHMTGDAMMLGYAGTCAE